MEEEEIIQTKFFAKWVDVYKPNKVTYEKQLRQVPSLAEFCSNDISYIKRKKVYRLLKAVSSNPELEDFLIRNYSYDELAEITGVLEANSGVKLKSYFSSEAINVELLEKYHKQVKLYLRSNLINITGSLTEFLDDMSGKPYFPYPIDEKTAMDLSGNKEISESHFMVSNIYREIVRSFLDGEKIKIPFEYELFKLTTKSLSNAQKHYLFISNDKSTREFILFPKHLKILPKLMKVYPYGLPELSVLRKLLANPKSIKKAEFYDVPCVTTCMEIDIDTISKFVTTIGISRAELEAWGSSDSFLAKNMSELIDNPTYREYCKYLILFGILKIIKEHKYLCYFICTIWNNDIIFDRLTRNVQVLSLSDRVLEYIQSLSETVNTPEELSCDILAQHYRVFRLS